MGLLSAAVPAVVSQEEVSVVEVEASVEVEVSVVEEAACLPLLLD